jgi:predicted nucleotidyltransferase
LHPSLQRVDADVLVNHPARIGTGKSLLRVVGGGARGKSPRRTNLVLSHAAKPVTRATAEKVLREFLARVERVNRDARFLGRVNRAVLFGSILREDVDRLSDLDLAVEVLPKIANRERLEARNLRRIESLARADHVFCHIFDIHLHWRRKVFRFLKSRSRVISLADYTVEKSFMNVPHRMLLGKEETVPAELSPAPKPRVKRRRPPRDCPF